MQISHPPNRDKVHLFCHSEAMTEPGRTLSNLHDAEAEALAVAIAEARADNRTVTHEDMKAWLLRLAAGEFDAPPPEPRQP